MGKIKNFVQKLTFGDRTRDADEVPKSGAGLFWFVLRSNWIQLILLNLLFCVCALPLVTLPAAYGALLAVVMKWARRAPYVEPYRTFFGAWKPHFLAKTGIGLLLTVAPFSVAGYVYLFTKNASAFYALLLVCGLVSFLVQSYFFAQLAVLDIGVGSALKNALILLGLEWKCTLKLLVTGGLLLVLCVVFTTYMIPLIVLCVFSLTALSVAAETSAVIDARLVKEK